MVKDLQMLFQMNTEANEKWCVGVRSSGKDIAWSVWNTNAAFFSNIYRKTHILAEGSCKWLFRKNTACATVPVRKVKCIESLIDSKVTFKRQPLRRGVHSPPDGMPNPIPALEKKVFTAEPESGLDEGWGMRSPMAWCHWRVFHFKGFFQVSVQNTWSQTWSHGTWSREWCCWHRKKIPHPKDGMLQCWTLPTNQIYSLYATFPPAILGSEFFTSNFETNVAAPSSFLS